jgi:dienelactone hydrolase
MPRFLPLALLAAVCSLPVAAGQEPATINTERGDRLLAEYFRAETARLADACLADIHTLEDWTSRKDEYRRQLLEMLGLDPLPEKTDLKATVTGTVDHELFTVEKVHFQSRPGLYVTGNLYVPKGLTAPAPAILYVCGHGRVAKGDVSFGNKVHYQHHGGWFARHGYVCLTIDTLQLGEIEGIHHGTYNQDMWWWNCRGYTPAGVEAWNCVRALDYLETRPEVDPERFGVTGRSGGGAYSWWIAAIDDRIKVAVPVAGITDLQNHVVDGTVEGHCDCMFMLNTYRWDYAQVAALVAPRPLLISNTDKDNIFPLEGVVRIHHKVRDIYRLHGADDRLGLHITEGPHEDTQELHIHAFHWFNRFLKGEQPPIRNPAEPFFQPEQLKVFAELPADQLNTTIHETFVPQFAPPPVPESTAEWEALRDGWMTALREKCFRGWPSEPCPLDVQQAFSAERDGLKFSAYDFTSQENVRLRLYVLHAAGMEKPRSVYFEALPEEQYAKWLAGMAVGFSDELRDESPKEPDKTEYDSLRQRSGAVEDGMLCFFSPRGIGLTAWDQSPSKQIQHRRRFMLLGQTLDGMRVWDLRRAIQTVRQIPDCADVELGLIAGHETASTALYAALFEPRIASLDLQHLPHSHRQSPNFLNVQRFLDVPQAVAMAAERVERSRFGLVVLFAEPGDWDFPRQVVKQLGWGDERLYVLPRE